MQLSNICEDPGHPTSAGLGFEAVDAVRRRVLQQTLGDRGHSDDPLFRIRCVLRRPHRRTRLLARLEAGDDGQKVGPARIAAHHLRRLYRCRTRSQAPAALALE